MAITIIQEPLLLQPINNPIPLIASSDNAADVGYRYKLSIVVFDVFPNDIGSASFWIYPDTNNNNYMIYDMSMFLSDYIGSDNYWNASGLTFYDNDIIEFIYSVEGYIGNTGVDETVVCTDRFKAFRGVKQYGNYWNTQDYLMSGNTDAEFLTDWKDERNYRIGDYGTLKAFIGNFSGSTISYWDRVYITTYQGDTPYQYYSMYPSTNPDIQYTASTWGNYTIPIGPANLDKMGTEGIIYIWSESMWLVHNGTVIKPQVTKYSIVLQYSGATWEDASETLWIYVDRDCSRFEGVQLLWLNDLGGYETFTFRAKDIKSYSMDREESRKNYWGMNDTTYNYSVGNRGRRTINIKTIEEHEVYSGWIDTNISEDLMELYRSPEVFVIKNDNIYPIIITNKTIEEKTKLNNNNEIFFHTINYEMAYEKLSNI